MAEVFLSFETADRINSILASTQENRLSPEACQQLLKLDPYSFAALSAMTDRCVEQGNLKAAERFAWEILNAHPYDGHAYLGLAALLMQIHGEEPERLELVQGLTLLGVRVHAALPRDEETRQAFWDLMPGEMRETARRMPPPVLALADEDYARKLAPAAKARLAPYRAAARLLNPEAMTRAEVDKVLTQGAALAPVLVGYLRGWAQTGLPGEAGELAAGRALALLGQTATEAEAGVVLEFFGVEDESVAEAAQLAFTQLFSRFPEALVKRVAAAAPAWDEMAHEDAQRAASLTKAIDHLPRLYLTLARALATMTPAEARLDLAGSLVTRAAERFPRRARDIAAELVEAMRGFLSAGQRRRLCEQVLHLSSSGPLDLPPLPTVYEICEWTLNEEEIAVAPPSKSARPGRNDPCWCGSGKKYKKCHLDSDAAGGAARHAPDGGQPEGVRNRLSQFALTSANQRDTRAAVEEFLQGKALTPEDELPLMEWMIHDWIPPGQGHGVIPEFLRRHGATLPAEERRMLEGWAASHTRLLEIEAVDKGRGVQVRDLLTGENFFVHDVSTSQRAVKYDVLMSRVVKAERGWEFAASGQTVARQDCAAFIAWLTADRARRNQPWPEYWKRNFPEIRARSTAVAEERFEGLRLVNHDGDPILMCEARYPVRDREAILSALQKEKDVNEDEPGEAFTWIRQDRDGEGGTILGHLRLEAGELVFTCNSEKRLKKGKAKWKKSFGAAAGAPVESFTSQEELKRQVRARSAERGDEGELANAPGETPEMRAVVQAALDRHYAQWPDRKLPVLGGKTPRQAVRTAAGRAEVEKILRDMENGEAHRRSQGEPGFDFGRLRAELGL